MITPDLQKLQFTSSGQIKLERPDKLRVKRIGGYTDVDLVFDGKTVSVYGNNAKAYVQADAAGTIDQLIDPCNQPPEERCREPIYFLPTRSTN